MINFDAISWIGFKNNTLNNIEKKKMLKKQLGILGGVFAASALGGFVPGRVSHGAGGSLWLDFAHRAEPESQG
jgi:hypothetical protein